MSQCPINFRLLRVGYCSHPECVVKRGGRWSNAQFPALCGLLEHPKHGIILFDTGYSHHFLDATKSFPERLYRWTTPIELQHEEILINQLGRIGIRPKDVRYVLISHFHGDHIAGSKDFPNAQFIATKVDYDSVRNMSRFGGLRKGFLSDLLPENFETRLTYAEASKTLALPDELRPFNIGFDLFGDSSVLAVSLPGHTRGQMGIVFRNAQGRLVFMVADACWSKDALTLNQPPTWLASSIFDNRKCYQKTFTQLRTLASMAEAPLLIPSHCEQTWEEMSK
ncbi:MAG: MBL fold metallo-hydrolase [Burkholderiaceae bacterium]|nr:MBL fold metallo-hydrolase [Burkholderiaceae bacterium]